MALSVSSYGVEEAAARERLPNRVVESCRPELFLKAGYPTEVSTEHGLARYVDVMHENRDQPDFDGLLGGFTTEEFELFKEITRRVAEFSERQFGRRIIPKGALTRAMLSFRHIRYLSKPGSTIFEIGPGCGYLGALLASAGYRYGATDITQAFYLYQNRLWAHLFGDRLIELADSDLTLADLATAKSDAIFHVPWWKYTLPDPQALRLPINGFVANHALSEMNLYSMCYTIRLAAQSLTQSEEAAYFFVEGTGGELLRSRDAVFHYFRHNGFFHAFKDGILIDVFAPRARIEPLLGAPIAPEPPPWYGSSETLRDVDRVKRAVKRRLMRAVGKTTVAANPVPAVPVVPDNRKNPIYDRIMAGRSAARAVARVSFDEVREFQRGLMAGRDLRTEDEMFFQYVFGTDYYS